MNAGNGSDDRKPCGERERRDKEVILPVRHAGIADSERVYINAHG